jgi:hypothetical protein
MMVRKVKINIVDKQAVLAAGRRVLTTIAAWTNFLFDGGAGTRLAEKTLPPDGVISTDDPAAYLDARSAGGRIEDSIVLRNLDMAFDFARTGQWRGPIEELVGVVNALEPFRGLLELNALSGPYNDARLPDDDRDVLLHILNSLLARRWLANGAALTLPQIALLADLSEKSVRMAATGRDRNPDLRTYKEGTQTLVKAEEAERWLRSRPDYKPTQIHGDVGSISLLARTNHQVAILLSSFRERAKLSIDDLKDQMGWTPQKAEMYVQLEGGWWEQGDVDVSLFDLSTVVRLARVFQIDTPLEFVRSISTVLLPYQIEQQINSQRISELRPKNKS